MKLYQVTAKGPLALNKDVVFRHSSRSVFLTSEEAEGYKDEFCQLMTNPLDEGDIGYLDPETAVVSVVELTIAGQMELPVPEGFVDRVMEALDREDEGEAEFVDAILDRMDREDEETLTELPEEKLAEVVPITRAKGRKKSVHIV